MDKSFRESRFLALLSVLALLGGSKLAFADPITDTTLPAVTSAQWDSSRYGPFNLFDNRSQYGAGIFPEPFLVDDSDLEVNEFRVDWLHTEAHRLPTDLVTGELEKGFGLLTLEVEVPWEREPGAHGFANVDLGARCPLYQYVSPSGLIDTTFGAAIEVGIPTNSAMSKNTEIVPKLFNDLAIGENFTMQSVLGYSALLGGGEDGGVNTFEYGFVFGYAIQHRVLPLPGVQQLVPVAELIGATQLNKTDSGHNSLSGDVGFRLNLKAIGRVQPRLGLVYVFPIDSGGREDQQWGIDTSLVFEF